MKTEEKTFDEIDKMFLDYAHNLHQKGLKYDTLKKDYDENRILLKQFIKENVKMKKDYDKLRIKNDQVLAKSLKAENQRDKYKDVLKNTKAYVLWLENEYQNAKEQRDECIETLMKINNALISMCPKERDSNRDQRDLFFLNSIATEMLKSITKSNER